MEHYLSKVSIPVYIHDHAVDIGLPEHLEQVAEKLRQSAKQEWNFDSFVSTIGAALEIAGGRFSTLGDGAEFSATLDDEKKLSIETADATSFLEEDDLRGVWLDLQSGLLTRRNAGWAVSGGGAPLLSLLSVLPNVRAVEIQRPGQKSPEFAVEPNPTSRGLASTDQPKAQRELAWH